MSPEGHHLLFHVFQIENQQKIIYHMLDASKAFDGENLFSFKRMLRNTCPINFNIHPSTAVCNGELER